MSSAGALPPPFRSLNSRRKDIAAPRSAAADDGRPKVSMVYPALGGGRRGACPFRRGFFAGRRDDGAAGAGAGASSAASVGGAGVAAPDKVWFSDPKTSSSLCLCDSAPDLPLLIDDGASSGAMSAKSLVSLASHFPALPRRVLPQASIRGTATNLPSSSLALVDGKCVKLERRAASQLAYTDTLGLSTRMSRGQRGRVRLPKTHHNNPNDDKMMA